MAFGPFAQLRSSNQGSDPAVASKGTGVEERLCLWSAWLQRLQELRLGMSVLTRGGSSCPTCSRTAAAPLPARALASFAVMHLLEQPHW